MTFFIPCKANNAPLLVEAVQCIRWSTPEAGIVVLDDERAPCPQTVKEVLRPLSVGWKLLKETHTSSDHALSILSLMASPYGIRRMCWCAPNRTIWSCAPIS